MEECKMPGFDFHPSITDVHFYRIGLDEEKDKYIKTADLQKRRFSTTYELGLNIKLGGLHYIKDPILNEFVPFHLNIVTYTQLNSRDRILHVTYCEKFDESNMQKGDSELGITLCKFDTDTKDFFTYDFVNNSMYIEIFYTKNELMSLSDFENEINSPDRFNILFKTKIPYINT